MTLSYLQIINLETQNLGTPQSAARKHRNHRQVTKAAQTLPGGRLQWCSGLIASEPVASARAQLLHTFDPTNTGTVALTC
jgi:hypothetical protein